MRPLCQHFNVADWPTGGLAALGFPNGAEGGAWKGDLNNMELLHIQAIVRVTIFLAGPFRRAALSWLNNCTAPKSTD
jgi:hypothetical protein